MNDQGQSEPQRQAVEDQASPEAGQSAQVQDEETPETDQPAQVQDEETPEADQPTQVRDEETPETDQAAEIQDEKTPEADQPTQVRDEETPETDQAAQVRDEETPETDQAAEIQDEKTPAEAETDQPCEPPTDRDEVACVEALLFASDSPLRPAKIAQAAGLDGQGQVTQAVKTLNDRYEQSGSAFRIELIAGGYQMLTCPEYHDVLSALFTVRGDSKLSQAALETLAIVAYRQPVLRADIEAIRGVASGEVLRGLLEKQLAKIVGRAEVIGRPMLYGTTRRFLELFGLKDLTDLPRAEELRPPKTKDEVRKDKPSDDESPDDESSDEEAQADESADNASAKPSDESRSDEISDDESRSDEASDNDESQADESADREDLQA